MSSVFTLCGFSLAGMRVRPWVFSLRCLFRLVGEIEFTELPFDYKKSPLDWSSCTACCAALPAVPVSLHDEARFKVSGQPYSNDDFYRAFTCLFDCIYLMDEMTCVNGTVNLIDISHYSLKIHSEMSMEDRKAFGETLQNNFPARIKLLLFYNGGAMMGLMFTMVRAIASEKLQKRVKNAGNVMENVYKDIPMRCLPVEYLPDDYNGPNAGTERQIIESMKRDLARPEVRSRLQYLSSDQWKVDKAQKPINDAPSVSFRKLNID